MNQEALFLDYLWDLKPNYFHMKDDESDLAFNRPALSQQTLDVTFLKLLSNGYIFIDDPIENNHLYLGLTQKGGELWEQQWNIDWSNYISFEIDSRSSHHNVKISSQNKNLILLIFPELEQVILQNIKFFDTFKLTYWKTLAHVFSVNIIFSTDDDVNLWQSFHNAPLPLWRNSLF